MLNRAEKRLGRRSESRVQGCPSNQPVLGSLDRSPPHFVCLEPQKQQIEAEPEELCWSTRCSDVRPLRPLLQAAELPEVSVPAELAAVAAAHQHHHHPPSRLPLWTWPQLQRRQTEEEEQRIPRAVGVRMLQSQPQGRLLLPSSTPEQEAALDQCFQQLAALVAEDHPHQRGGASQRVREAAACP
jgi:hypothetical protein